MSPISRPATRAAGVVLAAVLSAGCATGAGPQDTVATTTVPATQGPPDVATPLLATDPPGPASVGPSGAADLPPVASLTVEGADPVAGQLGAYTWHGAGSDGPWLAGSPLTLGAGEPIEVTLAGAPPVATWRARIAADSEGATPSPLAMGPGPIRFLGPAAGAWTVELTVDVADAGSATWYWELDVS